ncbi:RNB domain-containing ribonuclease [Desulforhopalus sp. IMCC35007]|uniref:RNB domain-containing ribonuclease n=1 Tax=Desulforhopalus sp. IMCC35007 TaxID=2569543 RepID=UPI0010AE4988|nr:RNB domain-containing ribonuclease [Desulforhopalus sp. IMCC35007]TKB09346.1 RNB domain-containing ribonuclease [Desulforhopalus sp. IMCC35007]
MIVTGKLIEYLDSGKFMCALVTESQAKRLRLINQNGRELNLPVSRVVHCSNETHPFTINRELLVSHLKDTTDKRCSLMDQVDLKELWELTSEESSSVFSPSFLVELTFGEDANDDNISAFLRCVFEDKLYFKYKEGKVLANSPEKVEQLIIQQEKEAKKKRLIEEGSAAIAGIQSSQFKQTDLTPLHMELLDIIKDYYLYGSESKEAVVAMQILKSAGITSPHGPYHLLVKAGIWSENENIPLLRNDLPVNFSLAARQQAEHVLQCSSEELFKDPARKDYTHLAPITIDGPTTLDFDDALTIGEQDGNYLVGIHISDVAHYVQPGDPLFLEAMRRGTSIYFPESQVPMLPRHLSQGVCSLIQDETRATFSFMVLLSAEAEILKVRIVPSIIRVKRRLTYDEVDKMLESDPEIKILNMLRRKLRDKRLEQGALLLPFPDVNIFIDHQGKVHVNLAQSDTPARTIVSEMMILANQVAAKYVADRMVPGLFRSQPPLKNRIVHGEDSDLYQNTLQRKNMPRGELSTIAKPHSGLGVSHYSTVTSPIRRLLDLVMQHQLNSIVRRQEPCFTEEMCKDFTSVLSRTLSTANNVRQQRQRYWLLKYLSDRQGQTLDALVINVGPKRVNLLLTDILMDIDLPTPGGRPISSGSTVKVRVIKSDPLDNVVRFDW